MINRINKYKSKKEEVSKLKSKKSVKKKILCVVGGVIFAAALMTGCGKQDKEIASANNPTEYGIEVKSTDVSEVDFSGLGEQTDYVSIECTNLTDVSALSECDNITYVDVSDNLITDISALEGLENLEYLDIANNSISEINLENFKDLKEININQNYNLYTNDILNYCEQNNIKIDINQNDVEYVNQLKAELDKLDLEGKTDKEKETIIFDYVTHHMEYDKQGMKDNDLASLYNKDDLKYAVEGTGVCSNYATLFDAMCELEGIHCYQIGGISKGDGHQWNLVEIDGEYMLCDATWADAYMISFFGHKYLNVTGEKANRFIDEHQELYEHTYDIENTEPTNIRNNMAVQSDVKNLDVKEEVAVAETDVEETKEVAIAETKTEETKEDSQDHSIENVISDIKGIFEGIDFSKLPIKEAAGFILAGIAAGAVRKLAKNTSKRLKTKLAKKKADKKLVEVTNEDIKEYEDLVSKLQKPVEQEIELPKEKEVQPRELTIEEQLEMLDSNEDKIAFLESMSDQTLRGAATKQVDLDMANGNTEKTFKEEKIQQAMQELLQLRGLTPEQKAVIRNINDGIFKDDFDLSQATSYEKESIAATIRFYGEVDSEMDKYEWLQSIQQQLTQDTTKSL